VRCTGEHQGLEANAADVSADMKKFWPSCRFRLLRLSSNTPPLSP
jgi:hypothetical protein